MEISSRCRVEEERPPKLLQKESLAWGCGGGIYGVVGKSCMSSSLDEESGWLWIGDHKERQGQ